jgi:quinol monooxygenase YgiN
MRLLTLLVGAAAAALAVATPARAQATGPIVITYFDVAAASAKPAAALLEQLAVATRKEPGIGAFWVLAEKGRPSRLAILGEWRDAAALEAHRSAPYQKTFRDKIQPMLVASPDVRPQTPFAVKTAAAGAGARTLYVLTHVDVVPPSKADAEHLLHHLADLARKDPGNLRFDVLAQTSRPNHFTLVEAWNSRRAFDAYEQAPSTLDFRERVLPLQGALYDERLYGAIR